MKFATFALLGILLLVSCGSLNAQAPGASQVVMAFAGGSVYTSDTTAICMAYWPIIGDLDLPLLFAAPLFGKPVVDKEHAYLIWVSDYSMQVLPAYKDFNFLALIPQGDATIYFTSRPDLRDWSDWSKRDTWGEPVARFTRKAGMFQSADGGMTGIYTMAAELVWSKVFTVNGKTFDFKDLIPHGMTCIEYGVGEAEAGTCTAIGGSL